MRRIHELSGFKSAYEEKYDTLHLRFVIEKLLLPLADDNPPFLDAEFGGDFGSESYIHLPVGGDEYTITIRKAFTAAEIAEIIAESEAEEAAKAAARS